MNTDNILVVHNLKKTFHGKNSSEVQAVRGISFSVRRGEIFGFLFLDEPTTGLDPNYREILWEQMLDLNRQGTTIFLTTHYMEEPERFCKDIAIVSSGYYSGVQSG